MLQLVLEIIDDLSKVEFRLSLYLLCTQIFCVTLAVLELTLYTRLALELGDPPASASQVLALNVCATTTWPKVEILRKRKADARY